MIALRTPSPRDPWPSAILFITLLCAIAACGGLAHNLGVL